MEEKKDEEEKVHRGTLLYISSNSTVTIEVNERQSEVFLPTGNHSLQLEEGQAVLTQDLGTLREREANGAVGDLNKLVVQLTESLKNSEDELQRALAEPGEQDLGQIGALTVEQNKIKLKLAEVKKTTAVDFIARDTKRSYVLPAGTSVAIKGMVLQWCPAAHASDATIDVPSKANVHQEANSSSFVLTEQVYDISPHGTGPMKYTLTWSSLYAGISSEATFDALNDGSNLTGIGTGSGSAWIQATFQTTVTVMRVETAPYAKNTSVWGPGNGTGASLEYKDDNGAWTKVETMKHSGEIQTQVMLISPPRRAKEWRLSHSGHLGTSRFAFFDTIK